MSRLLVELCQKKKTMTEDEDERASKYVKGKARSHSLLQNTLSSLTKVGMFLSLLQVNLQFCNAISSSSH
jgi:hypothetical protein